MRHDDYLLAKLLQNGYTTHYVNKDSMSIKNNTRYIEVSADLENAAQKILGCANISENDDMYIRIYYPLVNKLKVNLALTDPMIQFHGDFSIDERALILSLFQKYESKKLKFELLKRSEDDKDATENEILHIRLSKLLKSIR